MSLRKNPAQNWKLYCIIDSKVIKGKDPLKIARSLFKSGIKVIQLRYKNLPSYKLLHIAKKMQRLASRYKKILLINDRIDVAIASNAKGVHLGSGDMPLRTSRILLRSKSVIGKTIHSVKQAKMMKPKEASYVAAGPIFHTPLKKHLESRGIDFIKKIKKYVTVPVFAIGGINKKNVNTVLESGADGVCVTRAIMQARNMLKNINYTLIKR